MLNINSSDSKVTQTFINHSHFSYAVAKMVTQNQDKALQIIVENNHQVWQMQQELSIFLPQAQNKRVTTFPDWETLPYDQISAHRDITANRIRSLYQLTQTKSPVLITSINASMYKVVPKSFIIKECLLYAVGDNLCTEDFRKHMLEKGYVEVSEVSDTGQFAIRGAILDVMTTNSEEHGYRIELFDDEIDSIRHLDITSNRSSKPIEHIQLLPSKEYVLTKASQKQGEENIKTLPSHCHKEAKQLLSRINHITGIEYYLPLLHNELTTLSEYMPDDHLIIKSLHNQEKTAHLIQAAQLAYQRQIDQNRPVVKPERLLAKATTQACVHYDINNDQTNSEFTPLPELIAADKEKGQYAQLETLFKKHRHVLIFAQNKPRMENLYHCLNTTKTPCVIQENKNDGIDGFLATKKNHIMIAQGNLVSGMIDHKKDCVFISENDILGRILNVRTSRQKKKRLIEDNIEHWEMGTLIVHRDYGIGKFLEFTTIERDGNESDYLVLAYHGDDKLYVATSQFHLLSRYIGPKIKTAQLSRLDGKKWNQKKKKAMEHADQLAQKLLSQHAKRQTQKADQLAVSEQDYAKFCEYFPYTETDDQMKSIECVLQDIKKNKAMNRLLCGDVGFGKTEVAMRAAFVAAMSGHQVAILAPTAILAKQHYDTFTQRFSPFPIRVEQLSRLGANSARDNIKKSLQDGSIDIIIATHSLLQPDIQFKKLGLLIIDEEHKFGVKQKELMGSMATHAHTLAMSATPIPRTLHMSLAKLRDISVIATPPKNRQAICTFVEQYSDQIVKEAIEREYNRGGQCYLIHNDIRSLAIIKDNITAMLPQIRIRIMHAKQSKTELEHTMVNFQKGEFDLLLATTIVESGIDIANANTMIINRADLLGLSQIHQLKGRVGRSHHQAYAYLLTPKKESMTETALARMKTIAKQKHLGAGLNIALEDLEIRGAGDLLGKSQSGSVEEMGLSLYSQLLKQATQKATGQSISTSSSQIDIDLRLKTSIPETYIKDFSKRLNYYRLISCAENTDTLNEIKQELEDYYGMMPESMICLIEQRKIQQLASQYAIQSIKVNGQALEITVTDHPSMLKLLEKLHQMDHNIRILGQKIKILNINKHTKPLEAVVSDIFEK